MYTTRRVFDWQSQREFARISGDFNPIHLDPIAARRTQPGYPIVHGIHSLIWILDCFCRSPFSAKPIKNARAQFLRPLYVEEEVRLELSESPQGEPRARVMSGPEEAVVVTIGYGEARVAPLPVQERWIAPMDPPASPDSPELSDLEGLSGSLSFAPMSSRIGELFPAAFERFGAGTLSSILCSSCLVGMVAPGLHSMYSGLEVSFAQDPVGSLEALTFAVKSVSPRFRQVRIGITGPGVRGFLDAMQRSPPVNQAKMSLLKSLVSRDEFLGMNALIVGGSRGLGELTGKLIASGGGEVVITYATGLADAERVVDEIRDSGCKCVAVPYDVHQPASAQLSDLRPIPTDIYYFPTPRIFYRRSAIFDIDRFNAFNSFYLTAFYDLAVFGMEQRPDGIKIFHPSSTFVDTRPAGITEYAMSKAAAEVLSGDLSRSLPGLRILTRRLPRLPTDQTNSVVPVQTANPVDVILPIIREMHHATTF